MSRHFTLEPNEVIELKFRRHWILFVGSSFWSLLSAFVPFIAYPALMSSGYVTLEIDPRLLTYAGTLWLLIVWCALSAIWTDYYLDIWYVTDKRVINVNQIGFFHRVVSSWGIDRIVEVTVHTENFVQTLLGYGSVQMQTAGPSDEYAQAEGVPHPERVRAAILKHAGKLDTLEKTSREQKALLHAVSHEAKGYLSKDAAALAAIAESDAKNVAPDIKNLASRALQETRSGVSNLMSILGNGSLESAATKTFDASKAARDAAESFAAGARQKGLSMNISIEDGILAKGDEIQVRELVFKALVDNAIRYTLAGTISVSLKRDSNNASFSVEDTGVGMSPEDMGRLFSDGGHGERSKEVNAESTGFGLSTAKKILTAVGGDISGTSDGSGRGSKFVVRLPFA